VQETVAGVIRYTKKLVPPTRCIYLVQSAGGGNLSRHSSMMTVLPWGEIWRLLGTPIRASRMDLFCILLPRIYLI
jgi:hypothetical protein